MTNLIGLHDAEAQLVAAPDSWILHTTALSENPPPAILDPRFAWIVRLNWGYGTTGTLPPPAHYADFAQRCAAFVAASQGCRRWIIGNETNLPREWPNHTPITPTDYAQCFALCRNAIRRVVGHDNDEVLIAASGPWNNEYKYAGNPSGDWITYFADALRACSGAYDGFALHAYTHGYAPALVASEAKMDFPFQDRHYHFRCYRDYCAAIPTAFRHLPAYLTEANGDGPWQSTGLMPAMLREIDGWNQDGHTPRIHCVIFYRYPKYDTFYIEGRGDVINEYTQAARRGYQSPGVQPPVTVPTPPPSQPERGRELDPALLARGVEFDFVTPPAGTGYWRIVKAEHLDEQQADAVGPDHHILGTLTRDGRPAADVRLKVTWPTGDAVVVSKAAQPNVAYNFDFPMSASLNEFAIRVDDGAPSDSVSEIGMGAQGNPGLHTSTWIDYVWTVAEGIVLPVPPIDIPQPPDLLPTPSRGQWPVPGGVITGRFGQVYTFDDGTKTTHNGLDIGVPQGTPVLCVWHGVVKFADFDALYGNYVRVFHPAQRVHTFCAHLRDPASVKAGEQVQAGQTLGYVGMTGNKKNTGPHLHFECRTGHADAYVDTTFGYANGRSNPESILHSWGVRPDSAGAGLRTLTAAEGEPVDDEVPF